jgi:hypothetical protein
VHAHVLFDLDVWKGCVEMRWCIQKYVFWLVERVLSELFHQDRLLPYI